MRKALLALAVAAAVITGFAPALASAAPALAVHHARCTETAAPGSKILCNMKFGMGRRPGDVHVVVRTSVKQRVTGTWALACTRTSVGDLVAAGHLNGRTTVRRHLLGQVTAQCPVRMSAALFPLPKGGSVTMVFSWVSR